MTTTLPMIETVRNELAWKQKMLLNYLFSEEEVKKFCSAVMHSLERTPALAKCSQSSLMSAFLKCAELKIYPSSISGEAFIIPYGGEAQFQLGYQGIATLLYRSGAKQINAQIVYANDHFEYEEGLETRLVHRPNIFSDRGEAIGAYATVTLVTGDKCIKVMAKKAIADIRAISKNHKTLSDPELWMWKKTVLKQLAKLLPKNDDLIKAIALDNEDSDFDAPKKSDMRAMIDRPSAFDISALAAVKEATPAPVPTEIDLDEIPDENGEIKTPSTPE